MNWLNHSCIARPTPPTPFPPSNSQHLSLLYGCVGQTTFRFTLWGMNWYFHTEDGESIFCKDAFTRIIKSDKYSPFLGGLDIGLFTKVNIWISLFIASRSRIYSSVVRKSHRLIFLFVLLVEPYWEIKSAVQTCETKSVSLLCIRIYPLTAKLSLIYFNLLCLPSIIREKRSTQ